MAKGMLSELFSPTFRNLLDEEKEEEKVHQFQAQDPFRAMAHAAYTGGTLAGKGLGRAIAAAAGRDPRTPLERNTAAVEAAKAQVSQLGLDPDNPDSIDKFYRQVITILQQQGLAAEALEVGKEYAAEKHKRSQEVHKTRELDIRAERDKRAHELGTQRIASQQDIARARNITAKEIAEAKLTAEQLKDGPFKVIDYGDHIEVINRFNEVIRSGPKAMNPKDAAKDTEKKGDAEQAYSEYLAGLQRQYDAAVRLHNHPGVEGITGKWGRWVGGEKDAPFIGAAASLLSSKDAGAALALHEQVTGGTFLAGLAKLKAASKTGATGLGAVSEREGDKVQADAAALNRLQQAPDYRNQLSIYIKEMEGFAQRMAAAAQADRIAPRNLATKPLAAPKGGRPAAAPQSPPSSPRVEEWERGADGKPRRKR